MAVGADVPEQTQLLILRLVRLAEVAQRRRDDTFEGN